MCISNVIAQWYSAIYPHMQISRVIRHQWVFSAGFVIVHDMSKCDRKQGLDTLLFISREVSNMLTASRYHSEGLSGPLSLHITLHSMHMLCSVMCNDITLHSMHMLCSVMCNDNGPDRPSEWYRLALSMFDTSLDMNRRVSNPCFRSHFVVRV